MFTTKLEDLDFADIALLSPAQHLVQRKMRRLQEQAEKTGWSEYQEIESDGNK